MTQKYLFTGPSTPDLPALPGIHVLPPVAAGDLLRLPLREGDTVGIVDGYFHQIRAVRHKEILAVMARGVTVLGASSMGALRAAELSDLGMIGVGQIYADYATGRLEADDEVALLHGPAESGYRPASEPLVTVRATLAAAVRRGDCRADDADRIVRALAAMPYRDRTFHGFPELAGQTGLPRPELAALGAACRRHRVDVKRADARKLIDRMQRPARTPRRVPEPTRTRYLATWQLSARGRNGTEEPGDLAALRLLQLFAGDFPRLNREVRLSLISEECAATCGGAAGDAVAHGIHAGVYGPGTPDFLDQWLTQDEFRSCPADERLRRFLVRSYEIAPGIPWDEPLLDRLREVLPRARRVAAAAFRINAEMARRLPGFDTTAPASPRLSNLLMDRWACAPGDADLHALDRGFGSFDDAVAAAGPYYLLARTHPGLLDLTVSAPDADATAPDNEGSGTDGCAPAIQR